MLITSGSYMQSVNPNPGLADIENLLSLLCFRLSSLSINVMQPFDHAC